MESSRWVRIRWTWVALGVVGSVPVQSEICVAKRKGSVERVLNRSNVGSPEMRVLTAV